MLNKDGFILDDPSDIESHVLDFYYSLFASDNSCLDNGLIAKVVPLSVSTEDNIMLTNLPSAEEIRNAVFSMNANEAPGPDDFSGLFFQKYWEIVGPDVCNANFNSNLVVLVPKTPEADSIAQFRPIALANYKFKIITKVLADRLAIIAPKIVSKQQRGFIKGRQISDCIGVASEAVNLLEKRSFGGNIALKIDIKKAFDTMDWSFLLKVLHQFGFDPIFCNWVKVILESTKLSISVNGKSVGYFSCKRGVRQGDPWSPLLFCIAEDVLRRGISLLVQDKKLLPMASPRGFQAPSHVLYADDVLIFCRGTKKNLDNLMALFKLYSDALGHIISGEKSTFYAGSINHTRLAALRRNLGFRAGHLPFMYLGVPIFKGKPRKANFIPITDKIKSKLASWKGSLLSIMGRVELVKTVIQGMLIYSFHIYSWPLSLIKQLDQWIRNFIWSGNVETRKLVTVAWHKVCTPIHEGGLGVRSLRSISESAMLQRCWELLSSNCDWAILLRSRLLRKTPSFPIVLVLQFGLVLEDLSQQIRKTLFGIWVMAAILTFGVTIGFQGQLWIFFRFLLLSINIFLPLLKTSLSMENGLFQPV